MHAVRPGVLYGWAYRVLFCSSLFSVVVLVKAEVKANPLKKSVWCRKVLFCRPILLVAFVYSLSDWSAAGQDGGAVGGAAPGVLTAAGWANDLAERGHTSSCTPPPPAEL